MINSNRIQQQKVVQNKKTFIWNYPPLPYEPCVKHMWLTFALNLNTVHPFGHLIFRRIL